MMNKTNKQIILFFILNTFFYLIWEVSHSLLYNWNSFPLENTVEFYVPRILAATLGDIYIAFIIFIGISALNSGFSWMRNQRKRDYSLAIVSAVIISILIEIRGLNLPRWSYNSLMPTILSIGVSPLIQIAIIISLSLLLSKWLTEN